LKDITLPRITTPAGTGRHHHDLIAPLLERIRDDPAHTPTIHRLAKQCGYSPDQLTRIFKQHTGLSPQEYILQARIERAKTLLTESALSISQIADTLGYTDVYHFSRQFKQKAGVTPSAYRSPRGRSES